MKSAYFTGFFWISMTTALPAAMAGGSDGKGNGGTVYACPHGNYLVDLKEVELLPGLARMKILRSSVAPVMQAEAALEKLRAIDVEVHRTAIEALRRMLTVMKPVEAMEWDAPTDLGHVPSLPGCTFRNAILFFDDRHIQINRAVRLDPTDEAALYVHEVLYRMSRSTRGQQTTSLAARRITAYLFSDLEWPELLQSLVLKYLAAAEGKAFLIDGATDSLRFTYHSAPTPEAANASLRPRLDVFVGESPVKNNAAREGSWGSLSAPVVFSGVLPRRDRPQTLTFVESAKGLSGTLLQREVQIDAQVGGQLTDEAFTVVHEKYSAATGDRLRDGKNKGERIPNYFARTYRLTVLPACVSDYVFGDLRR